MLNVNDINMDHGSENYVEYRTDYLNVIKKIYMKIMSKFFCHTIFEFIHQSLSAPGKCLLCIECTTIFNKQSITLS